MSGVDESLSRWLATEEIRNLRISYSHYTDTGDIDRLADLFTEDAICDCGGGSWVGREAIRGGMSALLAPYEIGRPHIYPFIHVVTNHFVEITGPESAHGRCYLVDYLLKKGAERKKGDEAPLHILAVYQDEYRHAEGRWRISGTHIDFLWRDQKSTA